MFVAHPHFRMSKKDCDVDNDVNAAPVGANRLPARLTVRDDDRSLYEPSRSLNASKGPSDGL
jgi:hypothetical protein